MATNTVNLTAQQAQQLQQSYQLLQSGRVSEAIRLTQQVKDMAPDNADAVHLLALCHKAAGDLGRAEEAFQKAVSLAPEHAEILTNYANLLCARDRRGEALEFYRRAVEAQPRFLNGWINYGLAARDHGNFDIAEEALRRALVIDARSASAWHGLGNVLRDRKKYEDAEKAFQNAVKMKSDSGAAWVMLGATQRRLGDAAAALKSYDQARKTGFGAPILEDSRAAALLDLGHVDECIAAYERLCAENPGYIDGQEALAKTLWQYRPEADALASYKKALEMRPDDVKLRLSLYRILLKMEDWQSALSEIRAVREIDGDPIYAAAEAIPLDELGRTEEARARFQETIEYAPEYLQLRNAYVRHLLVHDEAEAAEGHAEIATMLGPEDQTAWAYRGTAWRLLEDPRADWLYDFDRLVRPVPLEPPEGFEDIDGFMAAVRETLLPMHHAIREPVDQTLRGGSQTSGFLFGHPDETIQAVRAAIDAAIVRHIEALPDDPDHPFLSRKSAPVQYMGAWSVRLSSEGHHINHIHDEGWISSALYVALPPCVREDDPAHEGWIQFGEPPVEMGLDLEPFKFIKPEVGRLALFPSYCWHGTVPFTDEAPRMTIAFDAVPAQ